MGNISTLYLGRPNSSKICNKKNANSFSEIHFNTKRRLTNVPGSNDPKGKSKERGLVVWSTKEFKRIWNLSVWWIGQENARGRFQKSSKNSCVNAAVKYLNGKQNIGDKGAGWQEYLNSYSNFFTLQRKIFSLRTKINRLKTNFSRNKQMKPEFCIQVCKREINNEHLT